MLDTTWGAQGIGPLSAPGSQVALARPRGGVRRGWGAICPRQGRKLWQAWRLLDIGWGAQPVGSLSAPGSQSAAGVALSRQRMGCAEGGVAIRARVANRGRHGTWSTQEGVRRGWGPAPGSQRVVGVALAQHHMGCEGGWGGRNARQAWHLFDTTWGAQGVGPLSAPESQRVVGVALSTPEGVRGGWDR